MGHSLYNTTLLVNLTIALFGIAGALFSFVWLVLRWNTPWRTRYLLGLGLSIATVVLVIGLQYAILFWVHLPAVGREQMAKFEAARAERFQESTHVFVGDQVPEFTVETLAGKSFSSRSDGRKVVLLNFFATWCGPCYSELPHLKQIWEAHHDNDNFQMLMIGREETVASIDAFRREHDLHLPIAADPDRAIYGLFASESIPRNVLISADGVVVFHRSGFYEEDLQELEMMIRHELAEAK
ncbi:Thiol-disulfide oxidoreductase ResA [Bremerella volcania]|uniref:Thiol-disulfide oxidoreductase ResA n=1 Tax=Bremerella volcania TaxID=2527984 RepID=A0A518CE78_9BACT|nr:TlpA disulfide reductase family protein [Bremerella volcania]QDU77522.1 Thiol-disulfide oxidoreductase ResA [Bremerella volcania]